jgi:Do/DeqQ family serine protease
MTTISRVRVVLYCLFAGIVGMVIGSRAWNAYTRPPGVSAAPAASPVFAGAQGSFAPIVDRDLPAVVNVSSSKVVRGYGYPSQMSPFPMNPLFRQFFGDDFGSQQQYRGMPGGGGRQTQRSLGSGVIVKPDGYIITNNHVIDGATDVRVTLLDKREFKARVIGADSKTDIAVLKIDAKDLPVLPWGDSSKVRVGDVVLAMGEPFGIGQSVTMGIISAKGRSNITEIGGYGDFIQTDAAINQGNSGGALVDMRGELIGINTAILTHGGGGNEGVGFAVPVNMAHSVMDQVISHGKVVRGYMGVIPQDITTAMAESLHLTDTRGVLMSDVSAGSPAAQAGIQRGDVVLELDGERVENSSQLRTRISMLAPGTSVRVKFLRDGAERNVTVKLAEVPADGGAAPRTNGGRYFNQNPGNQNPENQDPGNPNPGGQNPGQGFSHSQDPGSYRGQGGGYRGAPSPGYDRNDQGSALAGVSVQNLDSQTARQLRLPAATRGVVVTDVAQGTPAWMSGLQPGDLVQEVDHARVNTTNDFDRALRRAPGHTVLLLVNRQGGTVYLAVAPR